MKTEQATALIAQALLQEGVSNQPKDLSEVIKIPIIQVHNILSKLNKDGLIEIGEDENGKTYTVKKPDGLKELAGEQTETPAEPKPEKKVETPKKKQTAPVPVGRHTGKFIYQKIALSKSACAFRVISDFVEKNKPSLKQLKAAFPDEIVSRFGVINELKTAQDLSKDRNRYHLKDHQVLITSDGKKVVVTNQWSIDRFLRFCEAAAALKIRIRPQ
jgi:hypothetical protein